MHKSSTAPEPGKPLLQCERFRVDQITDVCLLQLQIFHRRPGEFDELSSRLGFRPPGPGETSTVQSMRWFWSAPGEWVILVPDSAGEQQLQSLQDSVGDMFAVFSQITDSQVLLAISGASLGEVLSRGSTVDFHPNVFTAGRCLSTRFAGIPVMLAPSWNGHSVLLMADFSFADYLYGWFQAASIETRSG